MIGVASAHVPKCHPCDERLLAGTREHDRPHSLVVGKLAQAVVQVDERGEVERVQRRLAVDGHDTYGMVAVNADHNSTTFFVA
jgi:hypothetical protein